MLRYPAPLTSLTGPDATEIQCAECEREASLAVAETDGWRCYSDGLGEIHPFCRECAEREFGVS